MLWRCFVAERIFRQDLNIGPTAVDTAALNPTARVCFHCRHLKRDRGPTGVAISVADGQTVYAYDCGEKNIQVRPDEERDCFDPRFEDEYEEEEAMVQRHRGAPLTGISELKNSRKDQSAVVCGSGPTLNDADALINAVPGGWPIVAVNEAIRKLGSKATYWVLSDTPILREYARYCPPDVTVLAMHDASVDAHRVLPNNIVLTVESQAESKDYDDGINFFSRGTVLIGAIEMLRYMGVGRFFCLGLDCYRTKKLYYYDGRKPAALSGQRTSFKDEVRLEGSKRSICVWVTPKLVRMIEKISEAMASGLWDKIEVLCVNSPYSQQTAIRKLSGDEFLSLVAEESIPKQRRRRRKKRNADEKPVESDAEISGSEETQGGGSDAGGSPVDSVVSGAGGGVGRLEQTELAPGDRDA
jgi:hypothetical protein